MVEISEIVGLAAGFCTTVSFLPQAAKAWRTKSTKDLSFRMLIILLAGTVLWWVYGLMINSISILVWNAVSTAFIIALIAMKMMHG